MTKRTIYVSHAKFNKSPNGLWPRGKVRLPLSPEVDRLQQIRLKARANKRASSCGARLTLGRLRCIHVNMIPHKVWRAMRREILLLKVNQSRHGQRTEGECHTDL